MGSAAADRKSWMYMEEKDLGELYTYLELFDRTYGGYEEEVKVLLAGIEAVYKAEYPCEDAAGALRRLRNPRNAGRHMRYTEKDKDRVRALRHDRKSVREISRETGLPKSTVSRLLQDGLSQN